MPAAIFVIDDNEELIYRGEGNSSLVVALKSKRQVLRLLKSDAKKLQQKNDENVRSLLLQHIDYNESVLSSALPKFFFTPPKLVCLDHEQLEAIRALVKGKRPSFRLGKTISNCDYALLMPDYCTIPKCVSTLVGATGQTLSIEIKPKQGFLPLFSLLSDPTLAVKSKVCRFGLSQFYKLQKKSINALSSYCPLDLFSGCRTRALHALFNLVLSPQNNFRVFADANLVYGDQASFGKSGNLNFLQEVLSQFLLLDNSFAGQTEEKENKTDNLLKRSDNYSDNSQTYNTRNGDCAHNNAIAIFCNLLLSSLYDDKIALENGSIENIVPIKMSILEQLAKAKAAASLNEPCFLGTFLAMFDISLAPLATPSVESTTAKEAQFAVKGNSRDDVNNNNNNRNIQSNGRSNNDYAENCKTTNGYANGNSHCNHNDVLNNNFQLTEQNENAIQRSIGNGHNVNGSKHAEMTNNKSATSQTCVLHQKRPKCVCSGSKSENCSAKLPAGSVLGSILRAQKLDKLDSLKAVELYESLCERYQVLKAVHYDWPSDLVNSFANEKYITFVEAFIAANLVDLEKFWSFLVSLTAKDCSLMVAIQRAEYFSNSGVVQSSSSSNTSSTPIWCSVHREPTTGHRYVVSISLTDLDFKQAYKVERSLHNDRRMVKAFWGALAKEPTAFPSDLHFCDLFPTSSTSTTSSTSSSSSLPPLSHSLLL